MKPTLHVVEPTTAPSGGDPRPDHDRRLRVLFRKEARLERQLLDVRGELAGARRDYAARHKLGFFPAWDHLRRLFS